MDVALNMPHAEDRAADRFRALLDRRRSDGVLASHEVDWCRRNGVRVAFDPVQIGWIAETSEDDIAVHPAHDRRPHLAFRDWTPEDAPVLSRLLSCEDLWRYLPETFHGPVDVAAAEALIDIARHDHHYVQAATVGTEVVGQGRLRFDRPGIAELSYWVGKDYWGAGIGKDLVKRFCDLSFDRFPDLRSLYARVHYENIPSQRVLESNGFGFDHREDDWRVYTR